MATRAPHFALAAIIVLGCGGSGTAPRCEKSEDCQDGLVCIVPVGGEKGVCSLASYGVTLLAPVEGTKVGAAGVEVKAEVKVTGPGGKPPDKVLVMVDGNGRSELALSGQDGAILSPLREVRRVDGSC